MATKPKLVKMEKQEGDDINYADVHEDEVANYSSGGWVKCKTKKTAK